MKIPSKKQVSKPKKIIQNYNDHDFLGLGCNKIVKKYRNLVAMRYYGVQQGCNADDFSMSQPKSHQTKNRPKTA